jgi:hypothetical protein
MAAELGNHYWKLAQNFAIGVEKSYTAEELWAKAVEYFEWNAEHPLYEVKPFAYMGEVTLKEVPKLRAMSILGFCLYAGIVDSVYYSYRKLEAYTSICTKIEAAIRTQKFEGASGDLLNAAIISRDLGLVDRVQNETVQGFEIVVSDQESMKLVEQLIKKFEEE